MTWQTIQTLIACLPEIIKLLQTLQAQIDESETEKKVADSVKEIHEAFKNKDASKLDDIFKS